MRRALNEKSEEDEKSQSQNQQPECAICFEQLPLPKSIPNLIATATETETETETEKPGGESITSLECGHIFHAKCIGEWIARNQACPLCRVAIDCGPVIEDCIICSDEMLDAKHNGLDQIWNLSGCEHKFHRELSFSSSLLSLLFLLFYRIEYFFFFLKSHSQNQNNIEIEHMIDALEHGFCMMVIGK